LKSRAKEGNASKVDEDGSDEMPDNASNDKRRVETEIEFLEKLLLAKRDKLKELHVRIERKDANGNTST
jgi:hypothetical protein